MAQIIKMETLFTEVIKRDVIAQEGTSFIAKAYLHYSHESAVTDLSEIDPIATADVTTQVIDIDRISVRTVLSLSSPISYNRVYLCDINDYILISVDIETITASEIMDTFVYNLKETNAIVV